MLVVFAGAWGFPLVTGIVHARRRVRWEADRGDDVFAGAGPLAAIASLAAGVLLVGDQSLVGLSRIVLSPGSALGLVLLSWLVCALPALTFASLAVLFSVASRNGIMGVIGPSLIALAMQWLLLVGSGIWVHMLLVASAFNRWHALFSAHRFYGTLVIGLIVSFVWTVICLGTSWLILRRRDFAGTPVSRRPGWTMPVRAVLAIAGVIALLAAASDWGPVGITAHRLQASLSPTFNSLTLLQQRELGRAVPAGAKLNIVPSCSRRGAAPRGPGDWVCTMNEFIPQPGALPFQQTPVAYDVSVQSNGCYKAQSPPSFIGQQTMRDAGGHDIVKPRYTIYGGFDTL